MYVEKNGYVIMESEPMCFLVNDTDIEFDDDINIAFVFETKEDAQKWLSSNRENTEDFEILRYERTIFISKDNKEQIFVNIKECEGTD